MLRNKNLDLSGRVLLLRAGRSSFAEKVCECVAAGWAVTGPPLPSPVYAVVPPPGGQCSQDERLGRADLPRP